MKKLFEKTEDTMFESEENYQTDWSKAIILVIIVGLLFCVGMVLLGQPEHPEPYEAPVPPSPLFKILLGIGIIVPVGLVLIWSIPRIVLKILVEIEEYNQQKRINEIVARRERTQVVEPDRQGRFGLLLDFRGEEILTNPLVTSHPQLITPSAVQTFNPIDSTELTLEHMRIQAISKTKQLAVPDYHREIEYRIPPNMTIGNFVENPCMEDLVLGICPETGKVVKAGIDQMVHIGVGGSSGFGKSKFMQTLAWQLATCRENCSLAFADLEGVTFSKMTGLERLIFPVADSERDINSLLQELINIMDIRKNIYPPGVENLIEYNRISDEKLERIICFIDETPALLEIPMLRKRIRTLATRARKYAIYLVLAGQDWRSTTIDASIRNQFSTVVQCKALNIHQSRVLLGTSDAVDLENPGEAILRLPGREPIRISIPLIGENEYKILPAPEQKIPELPAPEIDPRTRIIELYEAGISKTNIQLEVFGYKGGYAYDFVNKVIKSIGMNGFEPL